MTDKIDELLIVLVVLFFAADLFWSIWKIRHDRAELQQAIRGRNRYDDSLEQARMAVRIERRLRR